MRRNLSAPTVLWYTAVLSRKETSVAADAEGLFYLLAVIDALLNFLSPLHLLTDRRENLSVQHLVQDLHLYAQRHVMPVVNFVGNVAQRRIRFERLRHPRTQTRESERPCRDWVLRVNHTS